MTLFYVISLCILLILPKDVNGADIAGLDTTCNAGDTCTETNAVCDTTQSKCKIKVGQSCTADSDECVSGATCPTGSPVCTCDTDHVPDTTNGVCLKKVGQTCTPDSSECVSGATCPTTGTAVCTCNADHVPDSTNGVCLKKIGQPCTDAAQCVTSTGVVCSTTCSCDTMYVTGAAGDTSCKIKVGQSCTAGTNECASGATCLTGSTAVCTCNTDHVPDTTNGVCLKKVGQTCTASSSECVSGATCPASGTAVCTCNTDHVPDTTNGVCLKKIGQPCTDGLQCIKSTGVVCSTTCSCDTMYVTGAAGDISCKLKANETCTDSTPCTTNAVCSNENPRTCTCSTGYVKQSSGTCVQNNSATIVVSSLMLLATALLCNVIQ